MINLGGSVGARPSSTLLARNTIYNLVGQLIPLVVAIISIPLMIHGLGTDRFGVLTLVWMVIGYFSLFDLGLGRALTQLVAEKLSTGEVTQITPIVWTTLMLMFGLGMFGAIVIMVSSPWLVYTILKIPKPLQAEVLNVFYLLAASIPVVIITSGLSGLLAAIQRFDILNIIRIPMGVYSFLAPLFILPFSQSILLVTAVLVLGRLVICGVHFVVCLRVIPTLRTRFLLDFTYIKLLFRFGAWMTVTNVIGPLMVYLDRFVIGSIISVVAVAYYATPYEMVTKLWIIPSAIGGVLFPAFAASYIHDKVRTVRLFVLGTKYVALLLFPLVLVITAYAHEGLQWWLGDEFAAHSTIVLQWLGIGVFVNSLAMVFITLVLGVGRPDLSAKLHFFELPIYLLVLWWAIHNYGIQGAALAWLGRAILDAFFLFLMSIYLLGENLEKFQRMTVGMLSALIALILPILIHGFVFRTITVLLEMVIFCSITWFVVFESDERSRARTIAGYIKSRI